MNKKKKILVVEDDNVLRHRLIDVLNDQGFKTFEAADGEEGLALAQKEMPDLMLLDIVMPKMTGLSLLEKLRGDEKTKNIGAIFLTNLSDTQKIAEALEHKAFDYLIKSDWSLEDVVEKVKKQLGMTDAA